jgi:hypothetical protein
MIGRGYNLFKPGNVVRHRNGTLYLILQLAKLEWNLEEAYVYKPLREPLGDIWVRPKKEMEDGRFELTIANYMVALESFIKKEKLRIRKHLKDLKVTVD